MFMLLMFGKNSERFSKADRIRVSMLRSAIKYLKQGSKSVLDDFTEIKTLREELNSHRLCLIVHAFILVDVKLCVLQEIFV